MKGSHVSEHLEESWKALKTTVKRLEDNKAKLTVKIPAAEVDKRVKDVYKEVGKKNRIPGFRPGKAPRNVMDSAFGGKDYFLTQATDGIINELYPLAVDSENLIALGDPEFEKVDLITEGKDYSFGFTIVVKPELELSTYDPIEIELPSEQPTEEEIDRQIDSLREYYVTYEDVTGRTVNDGDIIKIELECSVNGEVLPGLTSDENTYEVGADHMPEGFDKGIIGMKIGQEKEFDFEVGDDPMDVLAKGEKVHAKVKLNGISLKKLPDVTDEWVKDTIGYADVADLRERVGKSILVQKADMLPRLKETECSHAISTRLQGEATEGIIKGTEQNLYQDFFTSLQRQGMTFDQFLTSNAITPEQFQSDVHKQAVDLSNQSLALDALARHLELEATEDDIISEFKRSGSEEPLALYEEWKASGRLAMVREGVLRTKASKWLTDNAVVSIKGEEKASTKKAPAKKTSAKKTPAKKTPVKKAPAEKKTSSEKANPAEEAATAEKPVAKKPSAKREKSE